MEDTEQLLLAIILGIVLLAFVIVTPWRSHDNKVEQLARQALTEKRTNE